MPNRLVIATHNRKKAGEMLTILGERFPNLELRTLADYPGAPEPEETEEETGEVLGVTARTVRLFGCWLPRMGSSPRAAMSTACP